jgi:hypothetical protein
MLYSHDTEEDEEDDLDTEEEAHESLPSATGAWIE